MVQTADVYLWGKHIGSISQEENTNLMSFRYTDWAIDNNINLSPIMMPAERRTYRFPDLNRTSFNGVPGLIADSLPDKFGNAVINNWLLKQGRQPDTISAVERLCYTGKRGMGALEYRPQTGPEISADGKVDVDELVELASSILQQRKDFTVKPENKEDIGMLLKLGTSAGGARAKAIIAWNPKTNEIRSGQIKAGDDFEYWILKLDGVKENSDKEKNDEAGYGKIEYAYYLMAKKCGIEIMECSLYQENGRSHFMTKRFDRVNGGEKLHMQTLAALTHTDYNYPGIYSYEEAARIIRLLTNDQSQVEELYRRMIFNVLAMNQDDHVKNISFLMDKNLNWRLSPAYDVGFAYNPEGDYTSRHQMTINGKQKGLEKEDLLVCGKNMGISRSKAVKIIDAVFEGVSCWDEFASIAGVAEKKMEMIKQTYPQL
jgi:serine/threonine-protein kinase HipA